MKEEINKIILEAQELKRTQSNKKVAEFVHTRVGELLIYDNNYSGRMDNNTRKMTLMTRNRQTKMLKKQTDTNKTKQICKGMAEIVAAILTELGIEAYAVGVENKEDVEGEIREDGTIATVEQYRVGLSPELDIVTDKTNDEIHKHYYTLIKTDEGDFISDLLTEGATEKIKIHDIGDEVPGFHRKEEHRQRSRGAAFTQETAQQFQQEWREYVNNLDDPSKMLGYVFDKLGEYSDRYGFEESVKFFGMMTDIAPSELREHTDGAPVMINVVRETEDTCDIASIFSCGGHLYLLKAKDVLPEYSIGEIKREDVSKILTQDFLPRGVWDERGLDRIGFEQKAAFVDCMNDNSRTSQVQSADSMVRSGKEEELTTENSIENGEIQ